MKSIQRDMPSFDIVSKLNLQEVENGVNQAKKEIENRFDFRGSNSEINWDKKTITFKAPDDYKMNAIKDVIQTKLHRRGVDIASLDFSEIEKIGGMMMKQVATLKQGIDRETAKKDHGCDQRFQIEGTKPDQRRQGDGQFKERRYFAGMYRLRAGQRLRIAAAVREHAKLTMRLGARVLKTMTAIMACFAVCDLAAAQYGRGNLDQRCFTHSPHTPQAKILDGFQNRR